MNYIKNDFFICIYTQKVHQTLKQITQTKMSLSKKIVVIGGAKVGKTTFVRRVRSADYRPQLYAPTMGVEINPKEFNLGNKKCVFNFWDCAGDDRYGGLRDGYYIRADAAILMFDLSNVKESLKQLEIYRKDFQRVCGNKPIVIVGTHADKRNVEIENFKEKMEEKFKCKYFESSAMDASRVDIQPIFRHLGMLCITLAESIKIRQQL